VVGVVVALVVDLVALRTRMVTRRSFWVPYALVLVGQVVTNGLLAGRKVVRYDPDVILGWRLAWAPVEDLLFGFALVLCTVCLWVFWGRRGVQREPMAGPPRWREGPRGG
jgi:lycopene cyclase domain-containing protein